MSDSDDKTKVSGRVWIGGILGATLFIAALIWGPWLVEGDHLHDKQGELVSSAGIIITGLRTALLAIAAGVITAAGLLYTHKSHEQTVKKDREQAQLTREGQVTGRYVEAVKLLASEKLQERLGGIYALERIMADSDRDHRTIVEVLSAFTRTKLQEGGNYSEEVEARGRQAGERTTLRVLDEDVKAALTVLTRRGSGKRQVVTTDISGAQLSRHDLDEVDWQWINLPRAHLRAAYLRDADLEGANLEAADLVGAVLTKACLKGASLEKADLRRANLSRADLAHADLDGALLQNARMEGVDLSRARLESAGLEGAHLRAACLEQARMTKARLNGALLCGANLQAATLRRADLSGANLQEANLKGALLDDANLEHANLDRTDLSSARGLETRNLVKARIYRSTILPTNLASHPVIQDRIEDCEDEDEARKEAAIRAALEYEERKPPMTGEGV
ncbi:pentapeptide repeat-containing protein [Streptomyces sp. NPDC004596]|uniref:pentapeptide repeat-containing protein n=1 Tax=Streptomyces sp. DSM 118148 TaxID=3448667 RepID=UPI0040401616